MGWLKSFESDTYSAVKKQKSYLILELNFSITKSIEISLIEYSDEHASMIYAVDTNYVF